MKIFGLEEATKLPEGDAESLAMNAKKLQRVAIINSIIVGAMVSVIIVANMFDIDTRNSLAIAILLSLSATHTLYRASSFRTAYWLKLRE